MCYELKKEYPFDCQRVFTLEEIKQRRRDRWFNYGDSYKYRNVFELVPWEDFSGSAIVCQKGDRIWLIHIDYFTSSFYNNWEDASNYLKREVDWYKVYVRRQWWFDLEESWHK